MNKALLIILCILAAALIILILTVVFMYFRKKKEAESFEKQGNGFFSGPAPQQAAAPEQRADLTSADRIYLEITACEDETMIGRKYSFSKCPVTLGRNANSDVRLSAKEVTVSRFHARIEEQEDGIVIRDVGSKYGTFINNRNIRELPVRLKNDDVIKLGTSVRLRYSDSKKGSLQEDEPETYVGFHLTNATLIADTERSKIRK